MRQIPIFPYFLGILEFGARICLNGYFDYMLNTKCVSLKIVGYTKLMGGGEGRGGVVPEI